MQTPRLALVLGALLIALFTYNRASAGNSCDFEGQEAKLTALYDKYASAANVDQAVKDDPTFDGDLDCVPDKSDNCPTDMNPGQADQNKDGKGDACQDTDGDGYLDWEELANQHVEDNLPGNAPYIPIVFKKTTPINLSTGKPCVPVATLTNPNEIDTDGDGVSDYCEGWLPNKTDPVNPDSDCDGITDGFESGLKSGQLVKDCFKGSGTIVNGEKKTDLSLIFGESSDFQPEIPHTNPNQPDPDTDKDGIADKADSTPGAPDNPTQADLSAAGPCGERDVSADGSCACLPNELFDDEDRACYPDVDSDGDGLIDAKDKCNGVVDPTNTCGGVILDKSTSVGESAADDSGGCSLLARARTRNGTGTMLCGVVTLLAFALARQFRH